MRYFIFSIVFFISLIFGIYLFFPFNRIKDMIEENYSVRIERMGFKIPVGITARNVVAPQIGLKFDRVDLVPYLFGFGVKVNIYSGESVAKIYLSKRKSISMKVTSDGNLKDFTSFIGKYKANINLNFLVDDGKIDFSTLTGNVDVSAENVEITAREKLLFLPISGTIKLKSVKILSSAKEGSINVQNFSTDGDLNLRLNGNITLSKDYGDSKIDILAVVETKVFPVSGRYKITGNLFSPDVKPF